MTLKVGKDMVAGAMLAVGQITGMVGVGLGFTAHRSLGGFLLATACVLCFLSIIIALVEWYSQISRGR